MPDLKEHNWRRAREDMEHQKYLELRKMNQQLGSPLNESRLRAEARKHANESCRLAIRQRNEVISA